MDTNTLHHFRTPYRSLKGALMVPFKGSLKGSPIFGNSHFWEFGAEWVEALGSEFQGFGFGG